MSIVTTNASPIRQTDFDCRLTCLRQRCYPHESGMKRFSLVIVLICGALFADTVYTYTGNDFAQVSGSGGPTLSDSVMVSFEISSLLPGNLTAWNGMDVGPLVNWTISDGINVLSSQNPTDAIDLGV